MTKLKNSDYIAMGRLEARSARLVSIVQECDRWISQAKKDRVNVGMIKRKALEYLSNWDLLKQEEEPEFEWIIYDFPKN